MNILITGTTRGLGKALFHELRQRKYEVYTVNRSEENHNSNFQIDLADIQKLPELLTWLDIKLKSTEELIFINNSSDINPIKKIGEMDVMEINRNLSTNIIYPIQIVNHLMTYSLKRLKIINITSGAQSQFIDAWSLYSTSKLAVTKFLNHLEYENSAVHIQHIDPGVMDTQMQTTIRESIFKEVDMFNHYYKAGDLKDTSKVAKNIVENYIKS